MASGILKSNSPYLFNAAAALGPVALGFGLVGAISPASGLDILKSLFGFKALDQREAENWVYFWSSRDFFLGAVTIAAWYNNDVRGMGVIMGAATGVCVLDGVVSKRQMGRGEWVHWGGVPVFAGLAAVFGGYFDSLY